MASLETQLKRRWDTPQATMLMVCLKAYHETYGCKGWFRRGDVVRFNDCVMIVTDITFRGAKKPYDWPYVFGDTQQSIPYWTLYESDEDVPYKFRTNLSQPILTFEWDGPL